MADMNPKKNDAMQTPIAFSWHFLKPNYWLIWLLAILLLPIVYLPLRVQLFFGKYLGLLCFHLLKSRRHTTLVNIKLCALTHDTDKKNLKSDNNSKPNNLKSDNNQQFAKQVFINAGQGIFESFSAWFRPNLFKDKVTINGLEHLLKAQQSGQAVLLLGAHYTLLDLGGLLCSWFFKADIVYRPQDNDLLQRFVFNARRRIFGTQIGFKNTRGIINSLKKRHVLWYTPDQDFGLRHGVLAPFFGVQAATITVPRRLAKIGNTSVMAVHFYRQKDANNQPNYHITITPALQNYPSDDEVADATRINQLLEGLIRKDVSQYMWFHRRFKNQPDGRNYYQ